MFKGTTRDRHARCDKRRDERRRLDRRSRRQQEREIDETSRFVDEVLEIPRVLPDVTFRDELTFWRGAREFRLFSMTGDATESPVLYLPAE